jgi:hypothetical protein
MFVRQSEESPQLFVMGGGKLPEWVVTVEEFDDLRDLMDTVRPRVADDSGVTWRKATNRET